MDVGKDRLGYINGLKGLAIMGVTMVHTGGASLPGIFGRIGGNGARGVQIFFLISGFLTFTSLKNCFPGHRFTAKGLISWYRKKMLRILPLYYLAILIGGLTNTWNTSWIGTEVRVSTKNIVAHILLLHGLFPHYTNSVLGVEWYLGALWLFLLISPGLFMIMDSLEKSIIFTIVIYILKTRLSELLRGLFPIDSDPLVYNIYLEQMGAHTQLLVYSLGIMLFFIYEYIQNRTIKNKRMLSYALLILALIMLKGQIDAANVIYGISEVEMFAWWFFIVIISQMIHASVLIDNLLFRTFGKYSYGIFLFQFIWINIYIRYINYQGALAGEIKCVTSMVALLAISILLNYSIEKPIQKFIINHVIKIDK